MSNTRETIAGALSGIEYDRDFHTIVSSLAREAKASGLLIIYGASDDLMEFEGAFTDEVSVYGGGTIHLDRKGALDRDQCDTDEGIADYTIRKRTALTIEAVWAEGEICWQYRTEIPHVTFDVMEGGDVFCRGLVIDVNDLPEPSADA